MRSFSLYILMCLTSVFCCHAQYPPQAGIAGSTAISDTSGLFISWANQCTVHRGYLNISNPSLGYASAGDSSLALGPADDYTVSLGDSGVAILTFPHPIVDGSGPDFAVFENGFINPADPTQAFLELAYVEVSSDGVNFFRFPATSLTQDTIQIPMAGVYMDATKLNNLAGKYVAYYGTPFDLAELSGISGLDLNHVTHVRLVDVIGAINSYGSKDSAGRYVNDPYPTPIPTGGFDLDAVGVIHETGAGIIEISNECPLKIFPNPAKDFINISSSAASQKYELRLETLDGVTCGEWLISGCRTSIDMKNYEQRIYILKVIDENGNKWVKKVVKL